MPRTLRVLAMTTKFKCTVVILYSLKGVCHCERSEAILMEKNYYIYIMTNKNNTVHYTGITNDLKKGVYEHREKMVKGFTRRYNITKLVYYEVLRDVRSAILREKQIKGGSRGKKIELIESMNREWRDLYSEV